jgi:hypothetical protein
LTRVVKIRDSDLRALGVKLQGLIVQSRARLTRIADVNKNYQMRKSLTNAEYVFNTISATIQTTQRIEDFMQEKFGFGLTPVLKAAGYDPKKARHTQKNILHVLNKSVEFVIDDLTKANAQVDLEIKK